MPCAAIFDLDAVLIDSQSAWNEARQDLARVAG
jgi:beta-phosphoglucomutase-like phosphatase (HAD superfamily)